MSKGGKGGATKAQTVDPNALAAAQTQSNITTAQSQAALNNANTYSPYGASTWQSYVDPTTGQTRYNLTQQLDPWAQGLMGNQANLATYLSGAGPDVAGSGYGLTQYAKDMLGQGIGAYGAISPNLGAYLSGAASPVSLTPGDFRTNVTTGAAGQAVPQVQTGVPTFPVQNTVMTGPGGQPLGQVQAGFTTGAAGQAVPQVQTGVTTGAGGQAIPGVQTSVAGAGQGMQGAVGPTGPIQTNLSPQDFGQQIKQAQDAAYQAQTQYLDPQFNQQEESLRQRLADQGIQEGSDAYSRAMGDFNRSKTMAYQQAQDSAVEHGNALQQQLFGQQLQSGQFANAAQAQQYVQQLQDAGFINQAQAQAFGQQIQAGQFANVAQGQVFGQGVTAAQLANQAQQQIYGQGLTSTQLANQAQQQLFGQGLSLADLYNQAAQQQFGQNLAAGQFANAAQQQIFGQGVGLANLYNQAVLGAAGVTNQAAGLGLQRAVAEQQAPIAATQALLSGAQGLYGTGLSAMGEVAPWTNAAPTWPLSIPTYGGQSTTVAPTNMAQTQQAATNANQLANTIAQRNLAGLGTLGNIGSQALFGQNLLGSGGLIGSGGGLFGAGGLLGSQGPLFGTAADASIAAGGAPLALTSAALK